MKHFITKEIKHNSESMSQRIDKAEGSVLQLDTSVKKMNGLTNTQLEDYSCLLYTSPSPRDRQKSRMPSSA